MERPWPQGLLEQGCRGEVCGCVSATHPPTHPISSPPTCVCSSLVLERALWRLEWEKVKESEAQAARDEVEAERMAMLSIDWQEFATVETIEFFDDEDAELPPPMTLKDVRRLGCSVARKWGGVWSGDDKDAICRRL